MIIIYLFKAQLPGPVLPTAMLSGNQVIDCPVCRKSMQIVHLHPTYNKIDCPTRHSHL